MPKPRPGARSLHKGLDGAPQNRRYTHVKAWFYTLLRRKILNQIRNNKQGVKRFRRLTGETKRILLPDASVVVLNGNSELTITKNWLPGSVRPVWLGGAMAILK
jgi:DNA-directed RNA polymerase specialized sigma24 family protein